MIRNQEVNYGHRFTMPEYNVSPEMTLGLDLREITFGNLAQSAGYATAAIGKWDSGRARRYLPTQRGFDFYYGFAVTGTDYWTGERYGIPSLFRGNELEKPDGFTEELFTAEALKFIQRSRDRPFLLYLAYQAPSGNKNLDDRRIRPPKKYLDLFPGRDPTERRTEYLAVIACMDDGVGQIRRELERLGLDRNTLVIFFSDNAAGTGAAESHPYKARNSQLDQLGEGGVRPCFIAWWPGVIPAGRTTDEFISSLDLFPTIAALTGAHVPAGLTLDGYDVMPVLQGTAPSRRTEMFWQSQNGRAARVGDFKWLDTPKSKGLFEITTDPGEDRDLSQERPEVLAKVKARWEGWKREMDAAEPRGPFRDY
jgi:arylsulfatase A-like enzyme